MTRVLLATPAGASCDGSAVVSLAALLNGVGADLRHIDLEQIGPVLQSPNPPADVLIADVRGEPGLPAALQQTKRRSHSLGVVIVTSNREPEFLVEALRAGVVDVIHDPPTAAEMASAVTRVARQRSARNVYAFVGAKGGLGTSTLAVNVAAALGRRQRTLLVDIHPQSGDLDAFFEARPRHSLADACANVSRLDRAFLSGLTTAVAPGLDLLPARHREPTPVSGATLPAVLATAADSYAHVVLDVAPGLLPLLGSAVTPATTVVVGHQEMLALRRADRLLRGLRGRIDAPVVFVLNRFDDGERPADEVERVLGVEVTQTLPDAYRLVVDSIHRGRPLDGRRRDPLVDAIETLAARLAGWEVAAPRPRFWLAGALRRPATAS